MKTVIIATSIIALACAAFFAGYFLNLQANTASDLPENLVITNVELGTDNSIYWVATTVNNTGISNAEVVKLLFNDVKQSSVTPTLPVLLAPDAGAVINATIDVTASEYQTDSLNIGVVTSKGNIFSKICKPSYTIEFKGTSSLTITQIQFVTEHAKITVKNTGTKSTTVGAIRVNNVAATIDDTSILTYAEGESGTISINLAWTSGNPYKFDVYDTSGQVVGSYQATAPS
jgi:hypothetical protein